MRTNLHHLALQAAVRNPEAAAVTYRDRTQNYGEFAESLRQVAAGLHTLGLNRGDRVATYLDKRLETVSAIFGTSAAGGVFVPINHLLRANQVAYIMADCDVRILFTTADRLVQLEDVLGECPALETVVVIDENSPQPVPGLQVRSWTGLCDGDVVEVPDAAAIDIDMAAILYTSGSTGKPKGVVLTHRNLIVGAESVSSYLQNTADDVILAALPISFDAGFSQLTTAFSVGAHVVLVNYLVAKDVPRLCAQHGVTGLTCVPPLWVQIVDCAWPDDARTRLRYFANTGGRMPKATLDRLRDLFPAARPYLMYGLTEAFRSTYLDPAEVDRRPDSIGKAIPNAEILVLRPDGSVCDAGEEGELVHRGALVSLGYWNNPERTAERFKPVGPSAAWRQPELAVWSGDAVVRDEEGFLYFVGRKDDMIKTSGYRVSPSEIEEVAYATGMVRDAVAMGVDDDRLGQRVVLLASPTTGTELDVAAVLAVMKRSLPPYMVPESIIVRDQLPRSPNGKFDRVLIKQELAR